MSEIQFKFNFKSKGKNIQEALKIIQEFNYIIEDNFYIINFSNLNDDNLTKLIEIIGHLNNTQIKVDNSKWIHTKNFKTKNNKIVSISLERYSLSTYPEFINQIISLKKLNLKNNRLAIIPESIGNLIHLQELDLSDNQINELPDSIGKLTELELLNLNENRLISLPESMSNLKSIKKIYIHPYLGKMTANTMRLLGHTVKEEIDVFLKNIPKSLEKITDVFEPRLVPSPKIEYPINKEEEFKLDKIKYEEREKTAYSRISKSNSKFFTIDSFIQSNQEVKLYFGHQLNHLLSKYNLSKFSKKLYKFLKWKIRLKPIIAEDKAIPIGKSKIGGHPDLPKDFKWPFWNERPLSFLLQINIKEIYEYDFQEIEFEIFPQKKGILYFFFDYYQEGWGDDGGWKVFHLKEEQEKLFRTPNPSVYKEHTYNSSILYLLKDFSLPCAGMHSGSRKIKEIGFSDSEWDLYHNGFFKDIFQWDTRWDAHYLFGYPKGIQTVDGNLTENDSLLLLLGYDKNLGWKWGHGGYIKFWIKDITKGNFENVWAEIDCI